MTFGRYLDVDLSARTIQDYRIPEDWTRMYMGGRGIGARILLSELPRGADPLGPDNVLVFGTGPLAGTGFPGASRNVVMAKSPKTGSVSGSYVGGYFPHALGNSAYDGILFREQSEVPCYLTLVDGKAELHEASELWGLGVGETVDRLVALHGREAKVSCIGPAGERLVRCAAVINDRNRAAGRPGFGAVMGSKLLKAVVVVGNVPKPIRDAEKLREITKRLVVSLSENPGTKRMHELGTCTGILGNNERGILPTRNFKEGWFDSAEKISAEVLRETILTEPDTCTGCPIRCKRVVETEFRGEKVTPGFGGPEYETVAAFGPLCLVDNLDAIALANQKCNDYGLDTISVGNLIAMVMEACEVGILDEGLSWGDASGLVDMVDKIGNREGIGDVLADGIEHASAKYGIDFAVHVKGQEVPLHEPRGKKAIGLQYAVSPRGAEHMEAMHDTELEADCPLPSYGVSESMDRLSWDGKPAVTVTYENIRSFLNSAITCVFPIRDAGYEISLPMLREAIQAVVGLEIDKQGLVDIGARNWNLLKIHVAREGATRADDDLPSRLKQAISKGSCDGQAIPDDVLQQQIDEYYTLRGWDDKGPTKETLRRLAMQEVESFLP